MKSALRIFLILVFAAVAGIATYTLLPTSRQAIPEINFNDIDGVQHSLLDYKGQPILMIFWATDCPGCIKEMPDLIALHEAYASRGLAMISVAMNYDNLEHVQTMRKQKNLPYLITWDETGEISAAFDQVRVTPTHFLISPEGEIVMRKIGVLNIQMLQDKLAKMGLTRLQS